MGIGKDMGMISTDVHALMGVGDDVAAKSTADGLPFVIRCGFPVVGNGLPEPMGGDALGGFRFPRDQCRFHHDHPAGGFLGGRDPR